MKKHKVLTKALSLSALGLAIGSITASASCSNSNSLFFTVKGKDLEVTFCDRGASIYSIKFNEEYMTYHPHDKNTFLRDDFYYGKCLGRVAGRFKDGELNIDGDEYQLEVNEINHNLPIDKNNCLHGGTHSFTAKNFERSMVELYDRYVIGFHAISPDMEAGFPGEVEAWYKYTIYKEENKMDLDIYATASKKTPVNMSNHTYFRLGNGGDILNHKLQLPNANKVAEYDNMTGDQTGGQIVQGTQSVSSYQNGIFNFTNAKEIGQDIEDSKDFDPVSGGYDHIWVYDETNGDVNNQVILSNDDYKLIVESDANGVIMYANCYPHEGMKMNDGKETDTQYAAITVEPYTFFTKTEIGDILIEPTKPFTRHISYQFSKTA